MAPVLERVNCNLELPSHVDVAVVGGGIIGCAAALYLSRVGVRVAVFEKGLIGGEQSSRNWGWCRQQGRDLAELELAKLSLELWDRLQQELQANLGFRRTGVMFVTKSKDELESWERWSKAAAEQQVESRVLSSDEACARTPGTTERWVGGLLTPSDGIAEPSLAAPVLAREAQKLGATIHERCAVRGMETIGGKAALVITERGAVKASIVLCAGGIWSSLFLKRHGLQLPQLHVNASVLRTTPISLRGTPDGLATPTVCLRKRLDGGLTVAYAGRGTFHLTPDALRYLRLFWPAYIQRGKKLKVRLGTPFIKALVARSNWAFDKPSPFEHETVRVWDPSPDSKLLKRAFMDLKRLFPALSEVKIAETWGGSIDSTPDGLPVISSIPELPGLFLATGFSGHGFGVGPAAGHLVADLILGRKPCVDPTPFRYKRFWDGLVRAPESRL